MSIEWVEDDGGTGMWLKRTNRNRYTGLSFPNEAVENMFKCQLRPDDVLICSYSKCGIHWVWENIRMLMSGEIKIDIIEKECSMMELQSPEKLEQLPSPRILNNHGFFDEQPTSLGKINAKVILLYRNPKDVAVSSHNHHLKFPSLQYQGDFDNFLHRFVEGKVVNDSFIDYLTSFEKGIKERPDINYLPVRYEDLQRNPIGERRRIASFLDKDYDDEFLEAVRKATTLETMRDLKGATSHKDPNGESIMYRKGKVGDWKDMFTVAQNQWFDDVIEKTMGDFEIFKFVYEI